MERHTHSSLVTRLIICVLLAAILVTGCKVVYTYYTLDSIEDVEWVTNADSNLNHGKDVTTCVAAWTDSLGHTIYLMRSKGKDNGMDEL